MEIFESEEDVMHRGEVPRHIQSSMKEANTIKVGMHLEGQWQWYTIELLNQKRSANFSIKDASHGGPIWGYSNSTWENSSYLWVSYVHIIVDGSTYVNKKIRSFKYI